MRVQVKFYLGQNEDCSLGDSTSVSKWQNWDWNRESGSSSHALTTRVEVGEQVWYTWKILALSAMPVILLLDEDAALIHDII